MPGPWADMRDLRVKDRMQRTGEDSSKFVSRDPAQIAASREIRTLGRERRLQEALHLFSSISYPDAQLATTAMDACARSLALEPAQRIFAAMPMKTVASYNVLINLFGRLKRVEESERLLSNMRAEALEPSVITMTSLITGYGMVHDSAAAIRTLEEIEAAGMTMGPVCYGSTLSACARSGDAARTEQLLDRMDNQRIEVDGSALGSAVAACARYKEEERGRKAFAEIRKRGFKPDVIAYTCLMNCHAGADSLPRAEALWAEMLADGIVPDSFAYNALLCVAVSAKAPERFRAILADMDARGLKRTRETEMRLAELSGLENAAADAARRQQQVDPSDASWASEAAQSTWQHSAAAQATWQGVPASSSPPPLPAGWQQHIDPTSGKPYYWMASDPAGTTTWQRPQ